MLLFPRLLRLVCSRCSTARQPQAVQIHQHAGLQQLLRRHRQLPARRDRRARTRPRCRARAPRRAAPSSATAAAGRAGSEAASRSAASRSTANARSPAAEQWPDGRRTAMPRLEHGGVVGGLVAGEREIGAADRLEGTQRIGAAVVPGGGQRGGEAVEAAQGDLGQQRLGVAEMAVGRGGADAGQARRLGDGEAGGALCSRSAPTAASTSASRRLPWW